MRTAFILAAVFAAITLVIPLVAAVSSNINIETGRPEDFKNSSSLPQLSLREEVVPPFLSENLPNIGALRELTVQGKESFKILNTSTGKIDEVSAADYVRGALASEMPASFHSQALAAQAVAAHTWALYCAQRQQESADESLKGADFSANPYHREGYITKEQFYESYGDAADMYWPKICDAADYALEYVLVYEEEPALTVYHSTSAGITEASDNVWLQSMPYLVPVESEGDLLAPNFNVTEEFEQDTLKKMLLKAFPNAMLNDSNPDEWLEETKRSESGYITDMLVGGVPAHGQEVRNALGLRSSCFRYSRSGKTFTFETSGYGHGVGMSQYGADFKARQGANCVEILAHYYPETVIAKVTY